MNNENPTIKGRASRNSCGGISCEPFTRTAYRAQHLVARFALPIETAAIVAALAFAGGAHHG